MIGKLNKRAALRWACALRERFTWRLHDRDIAKIAAALGEAFDEGYERCLADQGVVCGEPSSRDEYRVDLERYRRQAADAMRRRKAARKLDGAKTRPAEDGDPRVSRDEAVLAETYGFPG